MYAPPVGLYDNVSGQTERRIKGESIYDLAEDLSKISTASNSTDATVDHSIIISNHYDELSKLYDLPNDNKVSCAVLLVLHGNYVLTGRTRARRRYSKYTTTLSPMNNLPSPLAMTWPQSLYTTTTGS